MMSNIKSKKKQEKTRTDFKLSTEMVNEIKDSFDFYNPVRGEVNRDACLSILGNYGFVNSPKQDILDAIDAEFPSEEGEKQMTFTFDQIISIITKQW